jgi:hypothetical protein
MILGLRAAQDIFIVKYHVTPRPSATVDEAEHGCTSVLVYGQQTMPHSCSRVDEIAGPSGYVLRNRSTAPVKLQVQVLGLVICSSYMMLIGCLRLRQLHRSREKILTWSRWSGELRCCVDSAVESSIEVGSACQDIVIFAERVGSRLNV